MTRWKSILFCFVLLACAGALTRWAEVQRQAGDLGLTALRAPLSEIPKQLGSWSFTQDLPLESDVLRAADVDDFVRRGYMNQSTGKRVILYVGYWGRENVGTGHGPDVCYPAIGWNAESEPAQRTFDTVNSAAKDGVQIALHRFARWGTYETERLAVAFTAVIDGEYRAASLGAFSHRPRRSYECGGPFLAHVQVACSVSNADWNAAEGDALAFLESLLPALNKCFPQTECDDPSATAPHTQADADPVTTASNP